ncbi:MAG TPA: AMMECR1 domain-containing protein, partial [Rhizobacter sp.]
ADEWPGLQVEVSLLDPAEPMDVRSEAEALAALRPGEDGVIFEWQGHRATYLPQVWEQLPDARSFLASLKRKAGLPADFWAPEVKLARYRVRKFGDAR